MVDQIITLSGTVFRAAYSENAISQLGQEYAIVQRLTQVQPVSIQRFMENQAAILAKAIDQNLLQAHFTLPDHVLTTPDANVDTAAVPQGQREHVIGNLVNRLTRIDLRIALQQRFLELEQSDHPALSTSAILLRHAIVIHMVHNMLPAGRSVTYTTAEGDTIPSVPVRSSPQPKSALAAATDAIAQTGQDQNEYGELQVPYDEAARRFFLPQWVAFDNQGRLLVRSVEEAKAYIASMQHYLFILHAAVGLTPYMVADEQYQQKRYGMLGQLVNQGRFLTRYQIGEIIQTILRRAASHDLDRGVRITLPYFNDQKLTIEDYEFDVIPAGRIMFVPAFVVLAAHEQQVRVGQDTCLSPSTRRHLLTELYLLGKAFYTP